MENSYGERMYGYIDLTGKIVIAPQSFVEVRSFHDGRAWIVRQRQTDLRVCR